MNEAHELTIDEHGVSAFNSHLMDEMDLGERDVPRVSDIAWNRQEQRWEVRAIIEEEREVYSDNPIYPPNQLQQCTRLLSPVLHHAKTYKDCVDWEHNNEPTIRHWSAGLLQG